MEGQAGSCPRCGAATIVSQTYCNGCGLQLGGGQVPSPAQVAQRATPADPSGYGPYRAPAPTGDATGGVIPYKNPQALLAYYCAVFALIPGLGLILGPLALGLGIAGWRYYKKQPIVKGAVHAWIGIILGGLCTLGNVGLLCLPFFMDM